MAISVLKEKQRQEVLCRFEPSQVEVVRFCCENNNGNNFHFMPSPRPSKLQESLTLKKIGLKLPGGGEGEGSPRGLKAVWRTRGS